MKYEHELEINTDASAAGVPAAASAAATVATTVKTMIKTKAAAEAAATPAAEASVLISCSFSYFIFHSDFNLIFPFVLATVGMDSKFSRHAVASSNTSKPQ